MLKQYVAYLKDNPKGYWFKRKLYGWGWVPAKWQGWLVILVFVVLIALDARRTDSMSHSVSDMLINWVPDTFALVILLLVIVFLTGEKPRWQWGKRKL